MSQTKRLDNELRLEFPSHSCNEAFARAAVGAFLTPMDPTMEELADIKTAVSEAVTNSIVHGYPQEAGSILLQCRLYDGNIVEITVTDQGVGIPDIKAARTPMYTTGGSERSGMGFTIMERFMSQLQVESQVGQGTRVFMTRTLGPRGRTS